MSGYRVRHQKVTQFIELLETRLALTSSVLGIENSVADQIIEVSGFDDFIEATSVPSISPALGQATERDVIATHAGSDSDVTAVVLKPRNSARPVHQMPVPSANANHYEFLKSQINTAKSNNAGTIRFPSNFIFNVRPSVPIESQPSGVWAQTAHLDLVGLHDVEVDLNGSTIYLLDKVLGVRIEDSERLLFRNGTIRGTSPISSIANVVADSSDAGIRFEVLPEYRSSIESNFNGDPPLITTGSVEVSPYGGWRIQSEGYAELFTNRGTNTFNRFEYQNGDYISPSGPIEVKNVGNLNPYSPGDHVFLLHENNTAMGILLNNYAESDGAGIEDISLEDLTLVNISGMGVVGEVRRGFYMNRVEFAAQGNDFLAVASDGVHLNANGGDIVIENSILGPNGDDKITIKGNYWAVTRIDTNLNKVTVEPVDNDQSVNRWGWSGDDVVFIDSEFNVLGESQVLTDSVRIKSKQHSFRLASLPDNVQVGSVIGNVSNSGGRVIIRDSDFRETRSQGIKVQSSHVVVENNFFEGIGGPAISIELALKDWYEAINTRNIAIRDNTFARSSQNIAKRNELISFFQVNGNDEAVEVIDDVLISENDIFGTYNIGSTPPTVTSIKRGSEPSGTSADRVDFVVTFNEAAINVGLDNFVLDQSGLPNANITSVNVSDEDFLFGMSYIVTVATGGGTGRLSIDFDADGALGPGVQDVEGNVVTANYNNGESYDIGGNSPGGNEGGGDPPDGEVELRYRNKSTQPATQEINAQLQLYNRGSTPKNFNGMEIRYYMDPDGSSPTVEFDGGNINANAMAFSYKAAGYASIRIVEDTIVDPSQSLRIKFSITGGQFDQTNDSSWDPTFTNAAPTNAIDVYENGIRIWGGTGEGADPGDGNEGGGSPGEGNGGGSEDTTPPFVTEITPASPSPTNLPEVDFVVVFSEPVTGVEMEDFRPIRGGLTGGLSITGLSGSGSTYRVRATTGKGNGTLGLHFINHQSGGVTDLAGNPSSRNFFNDVPYSIDKTTPEPPVTVPNLELLYRNKSTQPSSNEVEGHLELFNRGTTTEDLIGLEIRYYFTPDGNVPVVELDKSNVSSSALSLNYNTAGYISIFVLESTLIDPGDKLRVRFKVTGGTFDQTNDLSWDSTATNLSPTDAIDVFWASEPI